MQTRCNALAWNPMEAFNFTVANEDCNLYSYDMRKLTAATCVHKVRRACIGGVLAPLGCWDAAAAALIRTLYKHTHAETTNSNPQQPNNNPKQTNNNNKTNNKTTKQDFVSAVMDVDYSPTGREFVAGSYDRSVRIFPSAGGHSREVYHTKRMQRVFCVKFSGDGSYVFSGSDDMNVRVWKAEAAAQLGVTLPREKHKQAYQKALVERYKHLPEVRRVTRHRNVPKAIHKAAKLRRAVTDADRRKLENRIKHSAPGAVAVKPERKKKIIGEVE